jgi:hypothetical protein
MDNVAERVQYALELRGMTPHGLASNLRVASIGGEEHGLPPIPWANKERVYELLAEGKKATPVEFIQAVAAILRVRPAWLAFAEGPCEAEGPADQWRELYLVDGKLRRFKPPEDPEDRKQLRRDFEAGFKNAESFGRVSLVVQIVFANVLARLFERLRERGTYQDDAFWRGEQAATIWRDSLDRVGLEANQVGTGKEDTDLLLRSLTDWERTLTD